MATNLTTTPVDVALKNILADTATWKAKGVHVSAIEKELTKLWKDGAEGEDGVKHPVTRTRVLNLIAVTNSSDGADRIKDVVAHMAGQHPSRTIVLISHPELEGGEASLDAAIEAHRLKTGRESGDVSWEVVTVNARGRAAFHLASVVNPLLITDLPTFVWWSGEPPFESELFSRLLSISDRVMVDSLSFSPPYEKDVPRLARLVRKWGGQVAFSDFNWARIRPWVEFTIQLFDGAQYRPFLSGIQKLTVNYEAHVDDPQPNPSQGILFGAWVASRLGWEPDKGRKRMGHGGWSLPYQVPGRPGAPTVVEITSKDTKKCASGEIFAISVECMWLGRKAVFEVTRSDDRMHATTSVTIEGSAPMTKTGEFEKTNDSSLLMQELSIFDRDRAYEGALEMASAILGGGGRSKSGK